MNVYDRWKRVGGLSSIGRASALQAGCQEFDPPSLQEAIEEIAQIVH